MGQGNAISHLMPPPFYAYRYVVAKARAPESSIQDEIDKIVDATSSQRYKVEVMPGIYTEAVTMKAYVDVVCSYGRVVIQPPAGTTVGVTMASNCMLQGFEVDISVADPTATGVEFGAVASATIEDCWITGGGAGDIGVSDASIGTSVIIRKCRIDSAATGYQKTAAGTTWFADCRVMSLATGIDIDINLGVLNLLDNELMGTGAGANVDVAAAACTVNSFRNTLNGDGWQIADSASIVIYSHRDSFTKVVHAGAGVMVCIEDVQAYRVYNGMKVQDAFTAIAAIGDAADTVRYEVRVYAGEYAEAITMAQYVDLVGESNQSVVITQVATNAITAAANSRIKNVRVEITAASSNYGIVATDLYAYIEDVIVIVTHSAGVNYAVGSTGTGGFEIHDSVFQIDNVASFVMGVNGSGTHLAYDSEFIHSTAAGYGVTVAAGNSLSSFNNKYRCDNGFQVVTNASTLILSYGDDYTTVVFTGTAGVFADLSGCKLYTCASGVAIGEWVYASNNDTVAEAQADALATMPSIGVVNYKPTTTSCYVKQYGYYYDANTNTGHGDAFVYGEEYWVSAATAGQIVTAMPPVWPQRAGVAVSTQRFKVLLGANLGLVGTNTYTATAGEAVEEWVFISAADTVDEADASDPTKMNSIGMIVEKPDATTAVVKCDGKVYTTGKGWAANDPVYISPTTPGDIVNVPPVMDVVQRIGTVVHDTGVGVELLIEIM